MVIACRGTKGTKNRRSVLTLEYEDFEAKPSESVNFVYDIYVCESIERIGSWKRIFRLRLFILRFQHQMHEGTYKRLGFENNKHKGQHWFEWSVWWWIIW